MARETNKNIEWRAGERPELREPVLVAGFQGWNDGGQGATAAVRWLARHLDGVRIASVRPDAFHVFTEMESRPTVRVRNGERILRWPSHDIYAIRGGASWPMDLLVLAAREPNLRWRTYCETVLEVARAVSASRVVTLGAFLAAVPHTHPVPVIGYAWDQEVAGALRRIGTLETSYEGPTGVVSVLADAARRSGLPAAGLWAAVPHYLPSTANPKAALALLRALRDLTDIPFDLARLEDAAAYFEAQVSEAVRAKDEVAEHVRELERSHSADTGESGVAELPNAADVIRAFEDLLREGRRGESTGG
jgi:proteasome assembly chaperone (PAC2) family protein